MQTLALPQPQWRSGYGFILAALGAAIGLGNIWRFSFVAGENGGGAFLLVYLAAVLLVGVPVMLGELAIGRATGREAASAFAAAGRHPLWRQAGLPSVIVSFAILTYYAVISGWALRYFADHSLSLQPPPGAALSHFQAFVAQGTGPLLWHAAFMAAGVAVVMRGIAGGIERGNKLLMPVLAAVVVALALHGLTLPGARQGLAFLFMPDWSALREPGLYLAALGQAFFSLGLAMGVLVTYGSYLPRHHNLPRAALVLALGDTLFAVVAAIVIFTAVFSFGMNPGQGPGLAFVTLPEVFVRMPGGGFVGAAFFGLLVVAAFTSLVALIEVPVAYAMQRWGMSRRNAALLIGLAAFVAGVPSSLGFGPWAYVRPGGLPILDAVDHVASNLVLPLSGLAIALFLGWHWRAPDAAEAAGIRSRVMARLWHAAIRYAAPAMIVVVLVRSLALL